MKTTNELVVTTPSDCEMTFSRVFDAPRGLVFDAYTKCEYLKQWLGAFEGWSLDVCTIDLKVGGSHRYEWRSCFRCSSRASGGSRRRESRPSTRSAS